MEMCLKKKMLDMLESKFGPFDPEVAQAFGLPPRG